MCPVFALARILIKLDIAGSSSTYRPKFCGLHSEGFTCYACVRTPVNTGNPCQGISATWFSARGVYVHDTVAGVVSGKPYKSALRPIRLKIV